MLAVSLAFGWPRPAFPASQIAPGDPMMPPLSARPNTAGNGTGDNPPDGATDRGAIADNPDFAANSDDNGKIARPVRLKLSQMDGASLVAMLADGTDRKASGRAKDTAPATPDYAANSEDRAGNAQTVHLKLAQMADTSLATKLADGPNENPPVRAEETAPATAPAAPAEETAAAAPAGERRFSLQFPPIRTWGNIGYDLRSESFGEIKYLSQSIVTKVNASTKSYIWQPWFAQVSGGLGLSSTRSSTGTSSGSNTTDNKVTSNFITGNAALNLLPYSRFPFEAHFDRSDNRLDTGLSAIDSSYRTTRYGLTQRYRTLTGDTQYMASYDRNMWESAVFGTDQQDLLRLEMTKRLARQTLQINGDITGNDRQQTHESTLIGTLVARHSYVPDPALSVESLGNLSRTSYRLAQGESDLRYLQLSSSAFWRPADKPLTVTGSARLFGMNSSSGASSSALRSASANLGAFYELSKNIRLSSSANVNINDSNGIQTVASNQSAGITYQPDSFDLATFRYTGFGSATVTNRIDPINSGQHLALQLGHSVNRSMGLGVGSLGLNLNQSASSDFDSSIPAIVRLSHSGSLTWSHAEGQNNTFLRLSASDSRAVSGTNDFFQLLNLQASRNEGLTRNASWAGNLTIQAVRQKTGIMPNAYYNAPIATLTTPDTPVTTTTTSSANLSYRHQRAFGVPRLRFVSELRIYGDMPLPVLAGPRQQESRSWENRLDYSIGRLQLRLSARVSEVSSSNTNTKQSLLMFSLNRPFGAQ